MGCMTKTGTEGQKTLSPEVESRRKERQKFWSAAGTLLAALALGLSGHIQSCYSDRKAEAAQRTADAQEEKVENAVVTAAFVDQQIESVLHEVDDKFKAMDGAMLEISKHMEYQDKSMELLQSLVLSALGNRRAVRDYEPPAPRAMDRRKVERAAKKSMPKTPEGAMMQHALKEVFQ